MTVAWKFTRVLFLIIGFTLAGLVFRSSGQLRLRPDANRVETRIGTNRVTITVTGGERIVSANGWPDHQPGDFPRPGNPNSIASQSYNFHLPAHPVISTQPTSAGHSLFGVALNDMPF